MNDRDQSDISTTNAPDQIDTDLQENAPENANQRERHLGAQIIGWIRGISVEPVLFLHNIASQIVWIASQDLMIDKACKVNFNFDENICSNLNKYKDRQEAVQDLVSEFMMWRSIFETCIKVIFILFLGAWGDRWGRKRPLVMCLTGLMLEAVVHLINSRVTSGSLETMMISSVPYSLGGGVMALLMLCFAHLADSSKSRQRTLRMGFLDSAYYLGSPVGNAIVAPLLDSGGYVGAFGLSIAIYLLTIIYVVVKISPIRAREAEVESRALCDVSQITDAVAVTVKPRPNRATLHILLLIMALLFDSLPVSGEGGFRYLYTKLSLGWTHTEYSHWSTFASVLSSLTMIVVVPVLSVAVGMPDGWMGVVGGVSRTISNFMYGLVNRPKDEWLIWTGAVVASLKNLAPVSIRSLLSKLAGPQDVGKVYAVMATLESLLEFASAPMYKAVYTATNSTRPGTFNFLSAGINTLLAITLLGVTLSLRKINRRTSAEESSLVTGNEETRSR